MSSLTKANHLTQTLLKAVQTNQGQVHEGLGLLVAILPTGVVVLSRRGRQIAIIDAEAVTVGDATEPELRAIDMAMEELGWSQRALPDVRRAVNEAS